MSKLLFATTDNCVQKWLINKYESTCKQGQSWKSQNDNKILAGMTFNSTLFGFKI